MIKIQKYVDRGWFRYKYKDIKTGITISHGLFNDYSWWGLGYCYHDQLKGFWLRKKNWL